MIEVQEATRKRHCHVCSGEIEKGEFSLSITAPRFIRNVCQYCLNQLASNVETKNQRFIDHIYAVKYITD